MKKLLIGGAFVAAAIAGSGIANAEEVRVVDANGAPVTFVTQEACMADGPNIALANPEEDAAYPYFLCRQGDDGLWYLFNSDTQ
ncbi:hypothetical protein PDG61_22920 [Mycolicibacterium sp. BiH015]|uniref:hypothetical protein n=1 Tax=Mycolicibacterium sp. BiH015 TaxID=3018808 RepID=UPI0022E60F0B|nr:hypothetical protein [Mycolicibacterium sp. BiH015]MDA2893784.1 hypothetical protein [Mycolicibacterium sp. BiH015]